jgi:hypothetical protein
VPSARTYAARQPDGQIGRLGFADGGTDGKFDTFYPSRISHGNTVRGDRRHVSRPMLTIDVYEKAVPLLYIRRVFDGNAQPFDHARQIRFRDRGAAVKKFQPRRPFRFKESVKTKTVG